MTMKKILFVDDEKELHGTILNLFPKEKYRVICAHDGLEGLQKCRNEEFDLIISDFKMPKLDGAKFFQQLRESQESKKTEPTPVLFTTAFLEELKTKRPRWEKCDFLEKPYQDQDLLARAYKLLGVTDSKSTPTKSDKLELNPGEMLFDIGDHPEYLYFVVNGVLAAYKKGQDGKDLLVTKIGTGELVGDITVISKEKRILKVVAEEKCELIMVPADKIQMIINGQSKWVKLMLENMGRRLEETIKRIA